jgi:hypothetical protein
MRIVQSLFLLPYPSFSLGQLSLSQITLVNKALRSFPQQDMLRFFIQKTLANNLGYFVVGFNGLLITRARHLLSHFAFWTFRITTLSPPMPDMILSRS